MAQAEVALHLWAAQIDVAILEADFFVLNRFFRRRKRRKARVVEDQKLSSLNLDLASRHLGVDCVGVAQADLADCGHDVLRADCLALQVPIGSELFVEHHLGDARAVAHVEKDEVAVVAAAVDPAHQDNRLPGMRRAQFTAKVGAFKTA